MSERTPAEEAASWFLRLQDPSSNAEIFLEWQRWLTASPEHRIAFEETEETLLRLARVGAKPSLPSAAEMAADTYDGSVSVTEYRMERVAGGRERNTWIKMRFRYAMAAGLIAIALIGGWRWLDAIQERQHGVFAYSTAPGQRQAFTLPEGSKITLDADSVLNVELTPGQRLLRLARGEAYFQVSKDPRRPFIVTAGGTRVRAVGTAFNVRMSDHRTVVAVVEGKVEVTVPSESAQDPHSLPPDRINAHPAVSRPPAEKSSSPTLSVDAEGGMGNQVVARVTAGQAVAYAEDGGLQTLPAAEASIATTWLDGRRQYLNEPLQYVLADVNRYTSRQIEVADAATGELKFTGTLNLENSDAWLRGLSIALPVTVTQKSDGVLLVTLAKKR